MENIQIFTSEIFGEIRTCQVNNQIMFVAKDVATALGYTNTPKAIRDHIDDDDKLTERFVLSGQVRSVIIINESGLYALILSSKLPQAKAFKHWVTAEVQLKQKPGLWRELLLKAQTPTMLEAYDVIADSLLENALYFFRDRIENAFQSRDYAGGLNGERQKRGKNDSIFERLDIQFTFEQAMQHSVAVKGSNVNHNTVRQMLKNWRKQGLVVMDQDGSYRKVS